MAVSLGIDVAKRELVPCASPSDERAVFANDPAGHAQLVAWAHAQTPERIVAEAPSTQHRPVAFALAEADRPVVIVKPSRIRAVAHRLGRFAKPGRFAAALIARFAAVVQPPVRSPHSRAAPLLPAFFTRRPQLQALLTAQRNQRAAAPPARAPFCAPPIGLLEAAIIASDQTLADQIAADPVLAANPALLGAIPGIGQTTAAALRAGLPERGQIGHRQLAALVGVAPQTRQRGRASQPPSIAGARSAVRTARALPLLSAIRGNPVRTACDQPHRATHKPRLVALVAGIPKLLTLANAMIRSQTPWNPAMPT